MQLHGNALALVLLCIYYCSKGFFLYEPFFMFEPHFGFVPAFYQPESHPGEHNQQHKPCDQQAVPLPDARSLQLKALHFVLLIEKRYFMLTFFNFIFCLHFGNIFSHAFGIQAVLDRIQGQHCLPCLRVIPGFAVEIGICFQHFGHPRKRFYFPGIIHGRIKDYR